MIFRILILLLPLLSSCAILYHAQVGEVDDSSDATPFEVKVSETGVNVEEGARIGKAMMRTEKNKQDIDKLVAIYSLFNMGPRTGNPVYDVTYAENLIAMIKEQCPSGKVTSLTSIREMRKYPVISGEIVKITGKCLK